MGGKTVKRGTDGRRQEEKVGSSNTDIAGRQQSEEPCQTGRLRHISQKEAQNIPSDPDPDDPASP